MATRGLLQVLALATMEPLPGDGDAISRRRLDLFGAMPPADPSSAVRGQYEGYLDVAGVQANSETETFVALRLEIENWRWAGVPILVRVGKALPMTAAEVVVRLRRPPQLRWGEHRVDCPGSDDIVLRIGRRAGVTITVRAKTPGKQISQPVSLNLDFADELGDPPQPYEGLLADALRGDSTLFPRWDVIEETWRIVQPLLDSPVSPYPYQPGAWGPASAVTLASEHGGWRTPQVGMEQQARRARRRTPARTRGLHAREVCARRLHTLRCAATAERAADDDERRALPALLVRDSRPVPGYDVAHPDSLLPVPRFCFVSSTGARTELICEARSA